ESKRRSQERAEARTRWNPRPSFSGTRESVDRHGLELQRRELAVECRHDAAAPLGDRLDDGGAVRAVQIQFLPGQIGRAQRRIAGSFFIVAVETIALRIVEKERLALLGLGGVRLLSVD